MDIDNRPTTTRFQKFFMKFNDAGGEDKYYQCESFDPDGAGLENIRLPFNFDKFNPQSALVRFYAEYDANDTIDDYEFFKYIALGEEYVDPESVSEFAHRKRNSNMFRGLSKDFFRSDPDDTKDFPKISYCDITEKDMFGYPEIPSSLLISNTCGIWTMHGFRKFEITIDGLPEEKDYSDLTQKACLYWHRIDNTDIVPLFEEEIRCVKSSLKTPERKYHVYIDTNKLGGALEDNDIAARAPEFTGRFEIHNTYTSTHENVVFSFPIKICVRDTRLHDGENPLLDDNVVSLDFGTSSTCAAIKAKGKDRLFSLSGNYKLNKDSKDNAYENPTNLMIYNWGEVFNQWQSANENCPFFLTKIDGYIDDKNADYDSGYTVEDEYQTVGEGEVSRRKMASIITQLKMIPSLLAKGNELKFTPYFGEKGDAAKPVILTDSLADEDNTNQKFNPIAFYGYLLSRAINNPANEKFYKTYQITYPVKFNKKTIGESIRQSLEYGIRRALPKTLRDAVDEEGMPLIKVQMDYPEPIACAGAIVGRQLKLDDDETPQMFAIFDLGGGTVDFAFGMFRAALDSDDTDDELIIENFGTDGDEKAGGEKLIHRLAYKIYCDNQDTMVKNRIKFVLPDDEFVLNGYGGLLSERGDDIANSNVYMLKENLARALFKYNPADYDGLSADNCLEELFKGESEDEVKFLSDGLVRFPSLRSADGNPVADLELTVTGIDDFIEEQIRDIIEKFKTTMEMNFTRNIEAIHEAGLDDFNPNDVHIFLGGNASRQHFVHEIMTQTFPVNADRDYIKRIGEGLNDERLDDMYKVNEKTAVAFGQLRLGSFGYKNAGVKIGEDERPPFQFNVVYIDPSNDEPVTVIEKNNDKTDWRAAGKISKATKKTELWYTKDPVIDRNTLIPLSASVAKFVKDPKKMTLYVRVHTEDTIEFRIGSRREAPSNDEPVNEAMILKLND